MPLLMFKIRTYILQNKGIKKGNSETAPFS